MKPNKNINIRAIQLCILEMMVDIDKLCRQYDIPYFLDGGSALGAKRHQGFIPWDDDFDIGMMRQDYERFIKVLDQHLDTKKYLYQNFQKDVRYNVLIPAMKIRRRGTYILETNTHLPNRCDNEGEDSNGLFIDVFVYDYMNGQLAGDLPRRLLNMALMPLLIGSDYYLHHNPLLLKKWFLHNAKKYGEKHQGSEYVGYDLTWTFKNPFHPYRYRYKDIFPLQEMLFEGHSFYVAGNIQRFLDTAIGGKWWEFPPQKDQIAKHTKEVRLPGDQEAKPKE